MDSGPESQAPAPDEAEHGAVVLRELPLRAQADELALVLAAGGIEHRVWRSAQSFLLTVRGHDAEAAEKALAAYEAEAAETLREKAEPPPPDRGGRLLAPIVGIGLVLFFLVTGEIGRRSWWFAAGRADAFKILDGELWRSVTALTLHADVMHVASNAVAGLIFFAAVARWLGPGLGAWAIVLSGALGNMLTAVRYHLGGHHSVGASTATFGALGVVAGLQFMRHRGVPRLTRRAWLSLGAALALLGMTGISEEVDVWAHTFGLAAGALVGIAASRITRVPGPLGQALIATTALAAVLAAWLFAASRAGHGLF